MDIGYMGNLIGLIGILSCQAAISVSGLPQAPSTIQPHVLGLDISRHQGAINWSQLRSQNLKFVFIKATEGGDYRDPLFLRNWHQAKRHGLLVGAYHFFTFCRSAEAQAKNFIRTVPKQAGTLAPVVDIEFIGNCTKRPKQDRFDKELTTFIQRVETHYQIPVIIYTGNQLFSHYRLSRFNRRIFWLRNYETAPKATVNWKFWQYTNKAKIRGIKTRVDINIFKGSFFELQKMTIQKN